MDNGLNGSVKAQFENADCLHFKKYRALSPLPQPHVVAGVPVRQPDQPASMIRIDLVSAWSRSISPRAWDEFASRCGGSFLSSWTVVRLARITNRVLIVKFYRSTTTDRTLIGQCAISVTRKEIRFLDRLLLLPEYVDDEWADCIDALINYFGPRVYRYGSHWNEEPPRALHPSPLHAIEQSWARDFHIDAVNFGHWESFSHYTRSISNNICRDHTKAVRLGNATVKIRHGWSALRDLGALVRARRHVMQKNHQSISFISDIILHATKILVFGKHVCLFTSSVNSEKYSSVFCVSFGSCLYYISGGVLPNKAGLGSFVMLKTLETWQTRYPHGRFVMGFHTGQTSPEEYTVGAALYRRKLRVTSRTGLEFILTVNKQCLM